MKFIQTIVLTATTISDVGSSTTSCDSFCQQRIGPSSYCKTSQTPPVCHGSALTCCTTTTTTTVTPQPTASVRPAVTLSQSLIITTLTTATSTTRAVTTTTTTRPASTTTLPTSTTTTTRPTTTVSTTTARSTTIVSTTARPTTIVSTTTTTRSTMTSTTTTRSTVASTTVSSTQCENYPSQSVPMTLWVEGPPYYEISDFQLFYARLASFIISNCVNMRTMTLVIRTPHPYFVSNNAGGHAYWPPQTSPIYTHLLQRLPSTLSSRINVLLYPYIYDSFARNKWVAFATDASNKNNRMGSRTVYDGIYSYITGWQNFVASISSSPLTITGYMIDYEEILRRTGTDNLVSFTAPDLSPYRVAYPGIKTGITFGYDDRNRLNLYSPYFDFLHLQVYDLYYPYNGADESLTDSIFVKYEKDPVGLANVIVSNVLTPTILSYYAGKESQITLMWSTQFIGEKNCLYPLGAGASCGINYEIHSTPAAFNQFMQSITSRAGSLSQVQHAVYTFNFMQQTWLPLNQRAAR